MKRPLHQLEWKLSSYQLPDFPFIRHPICPAFVYLSDYWTVTVTGQLIPCKRSLMEIFQLSHYNYCNGALGFYTLVPDSISNNDLKETTLKICNKYNVSIGPSYIKDYYSLKVIYLRKSISNLQNITELI